MKFPPIVVLIILLPWFSSSYGQFSHTVEEDTDHIRVIVTAQFPMGSGICPEPFTYTLESTDSIHLNVLHVWQGATGAAGCARTDTIIYYTWGELPCRLVVEQSWIWGGSLNMHTIEETDLCSLDLPETLYGPSINFYPNPSTGKVFIDNVFPDQIIEVFDARGQSILNTAVTEDPVLIELGRVGNGCYLVRIVDDGVLLRSQRMMIMN